MDSAKLENWPFVYAYWANGAIGEELRFSIRSILKWHPEARVVIVGDKPEWYSGEHMHLPRIKTTDFHAFQDCYFKLRTAAAEIPQFIWMMDDIYFTKPFTIEDMIKPKYVRHITQARFAAWKPKNTWAKTRARAYQYLLDNNLPTYDFAGHLPQPIQSATFLEMERRLRLAESYKNWECCYYNMFYAKYAVDYGRGFTRVTKPQKEGFRPRHGIFNHTSSCYRGGVETYLKNTFNTYCKYETTKSNYTLVASPITVGGA